MNILISTDSFKESLSAEQVGECIEKGFRDVFPQATYRHMPLADGGEGMVKVLCQALQGTMQNDLVQDPLGRNVYAEWGLINEGKTALIEIASASGLTLVQGDERNPTITSTYGTGQLLVAVLEKGVNTIVMGLGGSATNDGGAGILQALGGKLLDASGVEISRGGLALQDLAQIDLSELHPRCAEVQFIIACDVDSPLCGDKGASTVFAPQKGASEHSVRILEESISHFADIAQQTTGITHHHTPKFGAAGGTPLGLSLAFTVEVKSGIEVVLDSVNADEAIAQADLVITGEGQMDNQTLQGKVPYGIAKRAKMYDTPIIAIAGSLGKDVDELYPFIDAVFDSVPAPQSLEEVLKEAQSNIIQTSRNVAMILRIGNTLNNVDL